MGTLVMQTDMGHKHLVVVKGPIVSAAAMSVSLCDGTICLCLSNCPLCLFVCLSSDMFISPLTVSFFPSFTLLLLFLRVLLQFSQEADLFVPEFAG